MKTAVLFLLFNRPHTTKLVFEAISKAKPPRLYVASDGPRLGKSGEKEKVDKARQIITQVDWDCEIKTHFRDEHLGCGKALSDAITWFFDNEEEGIILEDDCLPNKSFFCFCDMLLERYRTDMRVWQISGFNPLGIFPSENNYFFSKYGPIWGWASWRRAWRYYDYNIKLWPKLKHDRTFTHFCDNLYERFWRNRIFDDIYNLKIDTWDYQWSFAKLINSGLSIIPSYNLVENIGFSMDATHTKSGHSIRSYQLNNLGQSTTMIRNVQFDKYYLARFAKVTFSRLLIKSLRLFHPRNRI